MRKYRTMGTRAESSEMTTVKGEEKKVDQPKEYDKGYWEKMT